MGSKIYVFAGDSRITDEEEDGHVVSSWDAFDLATKTWESSSAKQKDRTMPLIDNWGQAVALTVKENPSQHAAHPSQLPKYRRLSRTEESDDLTTAVVNAQKKARTEEALPSYGTAAASDDAQLSPSPTIYILRGFLFFAFDVESQTWTRLPDSIKDHGHFQMVSFQREVYAIGTYSVIAAGVVEKFTAATKRWSATAPLPRKLRSVGANHYHNEVYITGGIDVITETTLSSVYKLEKHTSNWVELTGTPLLEPRCRHATVSFRNKLWIGGGSVLVNGALVSTNSVCSYEEGKGWRKEAAMNCKREFLDLLVAQQRLYAVGGNVDEEGNHKLRTIEILSEDESKWEHVARFPNARVGFSATAGIVL